MKKILLSLSLFILPITVIAAQERSTSTVITVLQSYPDYGDGDVIFKLQTPSTTCKGYWLSPNSKGFNSNLSLLLSAYHASSNLTIDGHTGDSYKWGGSGTHYCKLYSVRLMK
jgi:hypothetical protein